MCQKIIGLHSFSQVEAKLMADLDNSKAHGWHIWQARNESFGSLSRWMLNVCFINVLKIWSNRRNLYYKLK